jgi:hypothetical protein
MTAPAAGWYPDPNDSGSWRWWDGGTWTSHVRPKAEQTAPVAVAQPVAVEPAAVQPAPAVPAPQPSIPQPAQPIQVIQPASYTPETPPSEQEYWHSPGAEIVQIPGRSATSHSTSDPRSRPGAYTPAPHNMHDWGDVGSPQTAGIWLLAFLPIIATVLSAVMGIVLTSVIGSGGATADPAGTLQKAIAVVIGYVLVLVISAWIFAGADIRTLKVRGYDTPSIWWMLVPLSPVAYFIARGKVVRGEGKRAWPPELLFFLSIMIPLILYALGMIFAMSVLSGLPGLPS